MRASWRMGWETVRCSREEKKNTTTMDTSMTAATVTTLRIKLLVEIGHRRMEVDRSDPFSVANNLLGDVQESPATNS